MENRCRLQLPIDIADSTDVSAVKSACPGGKVAKSGPVLDLAANNLDKLDGKVPEKWEGLAVGPRLRDGSFLLFAGTDYSLTQNDEGEQFDVYFRFADDDPLAGSIQCPLDATTGCFRTTDGTAATLPADGEYRLLPGVLHAYRVPADELSTYVAPVPPTSVH